MGEYYTNVDSFYLQGENKETGILLIHGLTGSPADLKGIGDYLHQKGFTVSCPKLSGHGTSEYDLIKYTHSDWYKSAEKAFLELQAIFKSVIVVGYSMGGLLALNLAARYKFTKLVLCAPALIESKFISFFLPIGKHFIKWYYIGGHVAQRMYKPPYTTTSYPKVSTKTLHQHFKLIKQTRKILPSITIPTLLLHGSKDLIVSVESSRYIYDHISSESKDFKTFPLSGHGLLIGPEREQIWQEIYTYIRK